MESQYNTMAYSLDFFAFGKLIFFNFRDLFWEITIF